MATIPHDTPVDHETRHGPRRLLVREMWASLAITMMWLVVVLDALFGPDIVSTNASGVTRVPSAVIVVVFAYLGTRAVARYGLGQPRDDDDD